MASLYIFMLYRAIIKRHHDDKSICIETRHFNSSTKFVKFMNDVTNLLDLRGYVMKGIARRNNKNERIDYEVNYYSREELFLNNV